MTQEALKLALEALEFFNETAICSADTDISNEAITALRQAITEAEKQEPLAWVQDVEFEQSPEFAFSWVKTRLHDKPLYTHPPQRTWVGLTRDEIQDLLDFVDHYNYPQDLIDYTQAKLKEKNT